jgi:hypothetical protein
MSPVVLHYLITGLRVRLAAVRSGGTDRGALSLEWVAIAIGLVVAAVAVGAFMLSKLHTMEGNIGNGK